MSWVAVAVGGGALLGGVASGAMGASQGSSTTPYKQARSTAEGTTAGYLSTYPGSLALSQYTQPAYLGLGSQNLQQVLFGSPAQQYNQTFGFGLNPDGTFRKTRSVSGEIPASAGLLDILGQAAPRLQELYQTGALRGVQGNLGLLNENLAGAQQFYDASNPGLTALRSNLTSTANKGLQLGSRLAPEDVNRITSGVRSDWARRGLGTSMPAGLDEALQLNAGGEALRQARQNFALNANQNVSGTSPDFARFIMALAGNPVGDAMNLVTGQQPLTYQGNTYDPYNPGGVSASNAGLAAQQNRANNQQDFYAGLGGGLLNMSGDLFGQYFSRSGAQPSTATRNAVYSSMYGGG